MGGAKHARRIRPLLLAVIYIIVGVLPSFAMEYTAYPVSCDDLRCENNNVCYTTLINGSQSTHATCQCQGKWAGLNCSAELVLSKTHVAAESVTLKMDVKWPNGATGPVYKAEADVPTVTIAIWSMNKTSECSLLRQDEPEDRVTVAGLLSAQAYVICVTNGGLDSCAILGNDFANLTSEPNCLSVETLAFDSVPLDIGIIIVPCAIAVFIALILLFLYAKRRSLVVQLVLNCCCCRKCYCCRRHRKRKQNIMRKQREVSGDLLMPPDLPVDFCPADTEVDSRRSSWNQGGFSDPSMTFDPPFYRPDPDLLSESMLDPYAQRPYIEPVVDSALTPCTVWNSGAGMATEGFDPYTQGNCAMQQNNLDQIGYVEDERRMLRPVFLQQGQEGMALTYLDNDFLWTSVDGGNGSEPACSSSLHDAQQPQGQSASQLVQHRVRRHKPGGSDVESVPSYPQRHSYAGYTQNVGTEPFALDANVEFRGQRPYSYIQPQSEFPVKRVACAQPPANNISARILTSPDNCHEIHNESNVFKPIGVESDDTRLGCNGPEYIDSTFGKSPKRAVHIRTTPTRHKPNAQRLTTDNTETLSGATPRGYEYHSLPRNAHRYDALPRDKRQFLPLLNSELESEEFISCTLPRAKKTPKHDTRTKGANSTPGTSATSLTTFADNKQVPSSTAAKKSSAKHVGNLISLFEQNLPFLKFSKSGRASEDADAEFRDLRSPLADERDPLPKKPRPSSLVFDKTAAIQPSQSRNSLLANYPIFEGHPSDHMIPPFSTDDEGGGDDDDDDNDDVDRSYSFGSDDVDDKSAASLLSSDSMISSYDFDSRNLVTPFFSDNSSSGDTEDDVSSIGGSRDTLRADDVIGSSQFINETEHHANREWP